METQFDLELVGDSALAIQNRKHKRQFGYDKYVKGPDGIWTEELTDQYKAKYRKNNRDYRVKLQQQIDDLNVKLIQMAQDNIVMEEDSVIREKDITEINKELDNARAPKMRASRAFANVSREDVNLLWYANKRTNKKNREDEERKRLERSYQLRAFNRDSVQTEIESKLRKLENIPHMTPEDRAKFLAKGRSRKIYSENDVPENLRGEERVRWLASKNKRQKLYDNTDSGYDRYVEKQRHLSQKFTEANKFKYSYTHKYSYNY